MIAVEHHALQITQSNKRERPPHLILSQGLNKIKQHAKAGRKFLANGSGVASGIASRMARNQHQPTRNNALTAKAPSFRRRQEIKYEEVETVITLCEDVLTGGMKCKQLRTQC